MRILAIALAFAALGESAAAADLTPEQAAYVEKIKRIRDSLHPQTGDVTVPGAHITFHLGTAYYYLSPEDARKVLVEAWGNPANAGDTLGLIFPAATHFWDARGWGAVVTYDAAGFVNSGESSKSDFDKAEKAIRDNEDKANEARRKAGAEPIHFVGWAQPPHYDAANHTMIWARDLQFGASRVDTLNYDVRVLGRRGFVSLNMISTMPELATVSSAADQLRQTAQFQPGSRYEDFDSRTDKKAALGLAGLVAAGAGVALAQKFGLLAVVLLFLKKGAVVLVGGFAALSAWLRRLFNRPKAGPKASDPPVNP